MDIIEDHGYLHLILARSTLYKKQMESIISLILVSFWCNKSNIQALYWSHIA